MTSLKAIELKVLKSKKYSFKKNIKKLQKRG
jgi:hypothetical protein